MMKFAENGVGGTFLDCRSYVGTWEQFNYSAVDYGVVEGVISPLVME